MKQAALDSAAHTIVNPEVVPHHLEVRDKRRRQYDVWSQIRRGSSLHLAGDSASIRLRARA
jgi:hypothetical protein